MSYNGTVRCSYCYTTGHNKRKCQKLTERLLDDYKDHMELAADALERNGEVAVGYTQNAERYRAQYMKRTKIDPATGAKVKNKTAKAERMKSVRCGYCNGNGHTRRVCETVKADYKVYLLETRQVRESALAAVQEAGIGAGSMITFPTAGYSPDGTWGKFATLNYITAYRWDQVCAHSPSLSLSYVSYKKIHRMKDPYFLSTIGLDNLLRKMKDVPEDAPMPSLAGSVDAPAGWLDGAPTIKEAFPTSGPAIEKTRSYEYRWPSVSRKQLITSLDLEEYYPTMATQQE